MPIKSYKNAAPAKDPTGGFMDKRVSDWLDANGRRFVELRMKGGDEYFKANKITSRLDNLDGPEWIEFFTLLGQLDGIIHALEPEDPLKASSFRRGIYRRLKKIEKYCQHIQEITGKLVIPKTVA